MAGAALSAAGVAAPGMAVSCAMGSGVAGPASIAPVVLALDASVVSVITVAASNC